MEISSVLALIGVEMFRESLQVELLSFSGVEFLFFLCFVETWRFNTVVELAFHSQTSQENYSLLLDLTLSSRSCICFAQ